MLSKNHLQEKQEKCTKCPFPAGTVCESAIPCVYNKDQGGTALRNHKPVDPTNSDL